MKSFKEMRQDPHCPRLLDPADYVRVGESDQGSGYTHVRHGLLARHGVKTGTSDQYSDQGVPFYDATEDGRPNYRCHHCGKHGSNIRYFIFFLHKPSGKVVVVGQICAKKLSLDSREELDRLQMRRDEYLRRQQESAWENEHADEVAWLREHAEGDDFLESLLEGFNRFRSLTDRQLGALQKRIARQQPLRDADRHQAEVVFAEEPPTDGQKEYLAKLAEELGEETPRPVNRRDASNLINRLKARVLDKREAEAPSEPAQPSWRTDPMSDAQRALINRLLEERSMPLASRRKARVKLDAGLTKGKASEWITRLQGLPEIGDAA